MASHLIPCDRLPGRGDYCVLPVGARIFWEAGGEFVAPDMVQSQRHVHRGCAGTCALDLSQPECDASGTPTRLDALPWIQQIVKDPTCSRDAAIMRIMSPRDTCLRAAAEVRIAAQILEDARRRVLACFAAEDGHGLRLPTLARLLLDLEQQAQALEVIARDGGPA